MRIAFFLLLLANLAFLAWAEWIDVPQPAPSNDVYAKLPRLKLVGEEPSHNKRPSSGSGSARKTALQRPAAPTASARCVSVGPFEDEAAVTGEASLLRERGLTARQRSQQGEVSKGFWVYIGGLSDHDVTQVMRTLQQSHVDDAKVVQEPGEDTGRISVGFFSDRERADRRAASLKKLGLEPEVGERKVRGTVFWMDVDVSPGVGAPTAQDLTAAAAAAGPIEVAPCPESSPDDGTGPVPVAPGTAPFRTKVATGSSRVP